MVERSVGEPSPPSRRRRESTPGLALAWRVGRHWWVLVGVVVLLLGAAFLALWLARDVLVTAKAGEPYLLREFMVDGADVALKIGAVIAGILGIYRYWYHRYEPLLYFVTCSPCPVPLLQDLRQENLAFEKVTRRVGLPDKPTDRDWERVHDLPIVVFHDTSKASLGISEGSIVDLRFETPGGEVIWAVALAFTFESMSRAAPAYQDWQIAVSLSLRRYFRIERPFHDYFDEGQKSHKPPDGWQRVEVFKAGYARLHGTTEHGRKLLWIASDEYSIRFRDVQTPGTVDVFYPEDDPEEARVLEYVGISLRVFRRSGLRYRGQD
jgi:hypothetical protein